jgi:hypothetical protein
MNQHELVFGPAELSLDLDELLELENVNRAAAHLDDVACREQFGISTARRELSDDVEVDLATLEELAIGARCSSAAMPPTMTKRTS